MTLYGGLVAAPLPPPTEDRFDIVVSAGGGAVGAALLNAAATAAGALPPDLTWALISGVNMPATAFAALQAALPPNATLIRFRTDFGGLLRRATLSISQAGYNTVCDVLQAGCRSLLVPFVAGGETEQGLRAHRLQALGLAHVLQETDLAGIPDAVAKALAAPAPLPNRLDMNGADQAAALMHALVMQRSERR
ncbi:MAG: glycosyltransferase [Paracoccaceae bacterium]